MVHRPATLVLAALAGAAGAQQFTVESVPLLVADHRVGLADADGDGALDVLVRGGWFLRGNGDGTFHPATHEAVDTGTDFALGDLDGDGLADVAAACPWLCSSIGVSLTTQGTTSPWGPATQYLAMDVGNACALGDIDGDGDLDVVTGYGDTFNPGGFQVHRNGGAGTFPTSSVQAVAGHVRWVATGDLDGDGFADVVGSNWNSTLRYLLSPGDGTLGAVQETLVAGETLTSLVTGDLDGDGTDEVVVSNVQVHSLSWSPTVGLAVAQSSPYTVAVTHHALADLDGDGRLDFVGRPPVPLGGAAPGGLAILAGDGALGFGPPLNVPGPGPAPSLVAGDLDGNGRPDLVSLHWQFPPRLDVFVEASGTPPWTTVGTGLAGTKGVPSIQGIGALAPGPPPTLALRRARADAPAVLVFGSATVDLPLFGGLLIPWPGVVIGGLTTDGAGQLVWSGAFPAGVASGKPLYAQAWILDPAGPQGWAATSGLLATTP